MTRSELHELYRRLRGFTERLVEPLSIEDMVVQTMPEVSPTKWHLGHTTWFFETFVLRAADPGYTVFDPRWESLFNSYYNAVGVPYPRASRGQLSRPTYSAIRSYRRHVDDAMNRLFERADEAAWRRVADIIEVGLHHVEQHQELILTDLKNVLLANPLEPTYRADALVREGTAVPLEWRRFSGGLQEIGHAGAGFAYDNELPRHRQWLEPFELGSRLVTCGEWRAFMADRGYARAELWLAEGWESCRSQGWTAPLYWRPEGREWVVATLGGTRPVDPHAPVCHVSYYEADAFARFAGARLPTEAEWEVAAAATAGPRGGNFVEAGAFHPLPLLAAPGPGEVAQLFGDCWEWTQSAYAPYPGYTPFQGALAEYNGKFMCNQLVLRGGSCATPLRHIRASYRNFFPAQARWQFSGVRLARAAQSS